MNLLLFLYLCVRRHERETQGVIKRDFIKLWKYLINLI